MSILIELLGRFSYPKNLFLPSPTPTQLEYSLSGFKTLNCYRCGVIRAIYWRSEGSFIISYKCFQMDHLLS